MKKIFPLFVLLFISVFTFSQITLNTGDMPTIGWTQRTIKDTLPLPSISYGNKGANQVYDFSALSSFKYDTVEYRALTSGQQSNFPNATLAVTADGTNFLFTRNQSTKLTGEGLQGNIGGINTSVNFNPVNDVLHFPTQYNGNFVSTWGFDKTENNVTLPGFGLPINQVHVVFTATDYDTIDGWGKTITPVGAYKSLREKRKEFNHTFIEYKLFSFSQWTTLSDTYDTIVRYSYLTKETKGSVVTFEYDTLDNLIAMTYSLVPPNAPIADFSWNNVSGGLVNFTDLSDNYPTSWSWNFGDASPVSTVQNPNHPYSANGNYNVCLTATNAGGSNMICKTVAVTLVSSVNNAPVAYDDTVSLLQGTTITIFHVATNDVDPDGDNICMTTVWGSPYVTEYIGGSCDMVSITPDSSFTGTDTAWYSICDNGNPVLCDTGMIIFTVTPNPALLPVAGFTSGTFTYGNCIGATTASTSVNTGSLVWTFHPYNPVRPDSVYSNTNTVQYYGDLTSTITLNVQVCLTATNQFGTSTKCDTVDLSCTTSFQDVTLNNIQLYPNPVSNILTIDMRNNKDEITRDYAAIEIYNALGEKVKFIGIANNTSKVNIPVSELPEGMYVTTIVDSKGTRKTLGRFTKE